MNIVRSIAAAICLWLFPLVAAASADDLLLSRFFADHTAVMLMIDPVEGRILDANRKAAAFYGRDINELRRMRIDEINAYPKEQVAELMAQAGSGQRDFFVFPHRTRHLGVRSVAVYSSPIQLPSGASALLSVIHDITGHQIAEEDAEAHRLALEGLVAETNRELSDRRAQQILLQRWLLAGFLVVILVLIAAYRARLKSLKELKLKSFEAHKLEIAVDQSPVSIVITDCDGTIEYVNRTCIENTGYSREELIGQSPRILQSGRTAKETYVDLWATIKTGRYWEGRLVNRRKDGSEYAEWVMINPVLDDKDQPIRFIAVKEDITEREQLTQRLQSLERYDALTGLANRFSFFEVLEQRLPEVVSRRYRQPLALINIDRFHAFNEGNGHEAGDRLLQLVAQRLVQKSPEDALVARLGPDEFAVLPPLEADSGDHSVMSEEFRWIRRVHRQLNEPFVIDGRTLVTSASVGVAFCDQNCRSEAGCRPGDFMRMADSALHAAKDRGGGQIAFFDAEASVQVQQALRLEQDLAQAIERDELSLALQAQVDSDGELVGAEALLRWRHATLGDISPARFIPLAEENGWIIAIGQWVLEQALGVLQRLRDKDPSLTLSVNISPVQIRHHSFVSEMQALLAASSADPAGLILEITESVFMDNPDLAQARLQALRELGVGIAIDDFGTGYSSLSYLKRLPVTELKIDQSFVAGLPHDPADVALVNIIVSAAAQLKLRVVAEGIETTEQMEFLKILPGIDMQGYFYDRPASVADWARKWLEEG